MTADLGNTGPIVAEREFMMVSDAMEQSSMLAEDATEDVEVEISDEEGHVNDELIEHPTRDDLHEQRERGQRCEGVIRAHPTARIARA